MLMCVFVKPFFFFFLIEINDFMEKFMQLFVEISGQISDTYLIFEFNSMKLKVWGTN